MSQPVIRVNQALLLLFSAMAIFTPLYFHKQMIVLLGIFVLWFISSFVLDNNWLRTIIKPLGILLLILLLDYILGVSHHSKESILLGVNKMPTFIWIVVLFFYSRHQKAFVEILPFILLFMVISSAFTIKGNIEFPAASRILAGTVEYYATLRDEYHTMNIGGYDLIFALVFSILPLGVIAIQSNRIVSVVLFAVIAEMIVTIILGAFMIGILFAFAMVVLIFIDTTKIKFSNIVLLCLALLFFRLFFMDILYDVGERYGIAALTRHSEELMDGTYSTGDKYNSRLYIYWNAVLNWFESPIWGQLFGLVSSRRTGHSQMLDFLEKYGLFCVVYYSYFKVLYKYVMSMIASTKYHSMYKIYFSLMILFMFVDRFDTFTGIGFCVFFFAPMIFIICDTNFVDNESTLVNK